MSVIIRTLIPLALLFACSRTPTPTARDRIEVRADPAGQESPLASPDGRWVARVPIEPVSGRDFATWWRPEILGADGSPLFKDAEGFPARFNVYWAWDDDARLWLYETDEGGLWVYALEEGTWARRTPRDGEQPPPTVAARRGSVH